MRLTQFSDFALRALIYLAVHPERRPTIREVSDAYGISQQHMRKVVNLLGRLGYIKSTRGPSGGLDLARVPETISLGKLLRQTEKDTGVVECLRPGNQCAVTSQCQARWMFSRATEAFMAELDRYSLADVAADSGGLRQLLGSESSEPG